MSAIFHNKSVKFRLWGSPVTDWMELPFVLVALVDIYKPAIANCSTYIPVPSWKSDKLLPCLLHELRLLCDATGTGEFQVFSDYCEGLSYAELSSMLDFLPLESPLRRLHGSTFHAFIDPLAASVSDTEGDAHCTLNVHFVGSALHELTILLGNIRSSSSGSVHMASYVTSVRASVHAAPAREVSGRAVSYLSSDDARRSQVFSDAHLASSESADADIRLPSVTIDAVLSTADDHTSPDTIEDEELMLFGDFEDADANLLFSGDTAFRTAPLPVTPSPVTPSSAMRRLSLVDKSCRSVPGDAIFSPTVLAQVSATCNLLQHYADLLKSGVQAVVTPLTTSATSSLTHWTDASIITPSSDDPTNVSSLRDSSSPPLRILQHPSHATSVSATQNNGIHVGGIDNDDDGIRVDGIDGCADDIHIHGADKATEHQRHTISGWFSTKLI